MPTAAETLVACLVDAGVDRAFCVPGESYLSVLDALRDSSIETVAARQEGGAAMMAEADAKLTSRPGICFVTRGPGATNASAGVHVAEQDSTPLVLFVGQVATTMIGRGAFQEVDYERFYGGMAKAVLQLEHSADAGAITEQAIQTAMSGRPGPVIVTLPEDVQSGQAAATTGMAAPTAAEPSSEEVDELAVLLAAAEHPIAIVGGSGWNADGVERLQSVAEAWALPVAVTFRRQQLFDHDHPNYAGDVGIGVNPNLRSRIEDADLVIVLGTRFSEIPSQSYTLLESPNPSQRLVHVHVSEVDRFPHADLAIAAHPQDVLRLLEEPAEITDARSARVNEAHDQFERWSGQPPRIPGTLQMGEVIQHLRRELPDDAVITNGAGNYASWVHRFFRFRGYGTQLAPTSGSMGYGLPAAIAAKLRHRERDVVCFAGDGCFQMTGQEFGTAVQHGANVIVVVVDNGMYGTIRMHQERRYPARVHATDIVNPDFAALARAYGGLGVTVTETSQFPAALAEARAAARPALLHLKVDPEAITPDTTLTALRDR
jgi:acetolactate synthase-1/2/3 large subunit